MTMVITVSLRSMGLSPTYYLPMFDGCRIQADKKERYTTSYFVSGSPNSEFTGSWIQYRTGYTSTGVTDQTRSGTTIHLLVCEWDFETTYSATAAGDYEDEC